MSDNQRIRLEIFRSVGKTLRVSITLLEDGEETVRFEGRVNGPEGGIDQAAAEDCSGGQPPVVYPTSGRLDEATLLSCKDIMEYLQSQDKARLTKKRAQERGKGQKPPAEDFESTIFRNF